MSLTNHCRSMNTLKALTLWQPWGELILTEAKRFETRSWSTNHRGPLLIHAAKRFKREEREWSDFLHAASWSDHDAETMPLGSLIGVCRLTEVYPSGHPVLREVMTSYEGEFGDFTPGRYAWALEDVQRFEEPIPWRGQQGLWNVQADDLPPRLQSFLTCFQADTDRP